MADLFRWCILLVISEQFRCKTLESFLRFPLIFHIFLICVGFNINTDINNTDCKHTFVWLCVQINFSSSEIYKSTIKRHIASSVKAIHGVLRFTAL